MVRAALRSLVEFVPAEYRSITEGKVPAEYFYLKLLRLAITLTCTAYKPDPAFKNVLRRLQEQAEHEVKDKAVTPLQSLDFASRFVAGKKDFDLAWIVYDAYSQAGFATNEFLEDWIQRKELKTGKSVFNLPLWSLELPGAWDKDLNLVASRVEFSGSGNWAFWRDWYHGFLVGKPLDWDLQREVALIPDEGWERGPARIAGEIEIIQERRALIAATGELKTELGSQTASITQRSHNLPPELVEEHAQVTQQFAIIWDHLSELEDAATKPTKSHLVQLLARTREYSKAIGLYCAKLGDTFLQDAAEELGKDGAKWFLRLGAGYWATQMKPVQSGLHKIGDILEKLIQALS